MPQRACAGRGRRNGIDLLCVYRGQRSDARVPMCLAASTHVFTAAARPTAYALHSTGIGKWSEEVVECRVPAHVPDGVELFLVPLTNNREANVGALVRYGRCIVKDSRVKVMLMNPHQRKIVAHTCQLFSGVKWRRLRRSTWRNLSATAPRLQAISAVAA